MLWIINDRLEGCLGWQQDGNCWESDLKDMTIFTDKEKERTELPVNGEWQEVSKSLMSTFRSEGHPFFRS